MQAKTNISPKDLIEQNYFLQSKSPLFRKALQDCQRVAKSAANVLIIGQSGTGKEIAAKYIHACSSRVQNPMIYINCNAYSGNILEAELFGYEAGAFPGAVKSKPGKFELAHSGTLFLDEIGDLSLTTQVKLLRTIETQTIERIGGVQQRNIEFKLISTTNKDLHRQLKIGKFRDDFFYRISTIVIEMPSIVERREDLPDLIEYFLHLSQKENSIVITKIEDYVMRFLLEYHYPGNMRELKSMIDRLVVLSENGRITKDQMPVLYNMDGAAPVHSEYIQTLRPWKEFKFDSEKAYLTWVMSQADGDVALASERLSLSQRHVLNKLKEFGLR